jgi:hypothetical protein
MAVLLDYVLNRFLIVFMLCILGSLTRDVYDTILHLTPISIKQILISSISSTVVLCAVFEYVAFNIATCVLVCFCAGIWSFKFLEILMNWEYVKTFLSHILKNTKTVVGTSLSETIEEINDKSSNREANKEKDNIDNEKKV